MPFDSLREYVDRLEKEGELMRIKAEVDWNLELGAIMRRANDLREPALLFERSKITPGLSCPRQLRRGYEAKHLRKALYRTGSSQGDSPVGDY